ncbi:MAG TPA: GIY-YIG nuclease family protein [Thermoanaerobaculia bacterium]|nr:GIY-YIG nuclease family protein [Thermoanaerobaculia bacterium]
MARQFHVYILTNHTRTVLYTGVTSDLRQRLWQHRNGAGSRFAQRYRVTRLVYVETWPTAIEAIQREKQIKAGSRQRKLALIASINPDWRDLAADLGSV